MLKRICQSRKLAALKTDGARLLYTWLIPNVDVNGSFSADSQVIKGQVFTRLRKSLKTIESYLCDLEQNKLIVRYIVNSDSYLQIPDFAEKQPHLRPDREGPVTIPILEKQPTDNNFKKKTIPIELVRQVYKRDGKICQICGKVGIEDAHFKHYVIEKTESGKEIAFEIDHIIPEYLGGETALENLKLTCRKCNRAKGFKDTPSQLRHNSVTTPHKIEGKGKIEIERERKAKFVPPTIEEIKQYIQENPELSNIDPKDFWKGYADSDPPWIDTRGNPVRNWKLKLRTRSNFARKDAAGGSLTGKCYCGKRGDYAGKDDTGQAYFYCDSHKSKKKFTPALPTKITDGMFKPIPEPVDVNNERNRQMKELEK